MRASQVISDTVDHPQSVPPAKKRKASIPLSDPPRRSPSPAASLTLSAKIGHDASYPTQDSTALLDQIPDWHTHAASLHRSTGGDFTARFRRVSLLLPPQASRTIQTYLTERNTFPFATAEEVQIALSEQPFSVGDVFQLRTRRENKS
ncbi:hypothetical protein J6590_078543 [Homalodisca vitripennis]|nr:hypothetical protein J6590_078543 [Homalodisca vitripennis]